MTSIIRLYEDVCWQQLIPPTRQKDIKTAMTYLASSLDSTPDTLQLDQMIEATYRQRFRDYFLIHPKGQSTIRNTIQAIGQLFKAIHQLDQSPPIPLAPPAIPKTEVARQHLVAHSPYQHAVWLARHRYRLTSEHWPSDIARAWAGYRQHAMSRTRANSVKQRDEQMKTYVSYHLLAPDARLEMIHPDALRKLRLASFEHDMLTITTPPVLTSLDELFDLPRLQSFVTWHAWRVHTPEDAAILTKAPARPTTWGQHVITTIGLLAKHLKRPEVEALYTWIYALPRPKRIHNKRAPYHRFELSEIEGVAQGLMREARQMHIDYHKRYPGSVQAVRFQTGLILAMGWRNPMRGRNWCEAILDINLKHEGHHWYWHFEGTELKIATRRGEVNVFQPDVDLSVVPWLEEYLECFRPHLPNAGHDRHVLLSQWGRPLTRSLLTYRLRTHVYRFTGKLFYTHLLRSLFMSHHMTSGVDVNSIAYAMNDTPATVVAAYNELMDDKHRPIIAEANRRALIQSNSQALTPPNILAIPKPPKKNPAQMEFF